MSKIDKVEIKVGLKFTIKSLPNDIFEIISANKNEDIVIKSDLYGFIQKCTHTGMDACFATDIWTPTP